MTQCLGMELTIILYKQFIFWCFSDIIGRETKWELVLWKHYLKLHSHTSQNHFIRPVVIIFHSLYSFFFIIDAVIMDKGVLMITYLGCGDFIAAS